MDVSRRAVLGAAAGAVITAATGAASSSPAAGAGPPRPVIYDSDLDFDDASTLAYLCQEHLLGRIDLRAVTVANNGFGRPQRTLRHAVSVLEQSGLPWIPVAEGATGQGRNPAPPELVATIENVLSGALGDGDRPPQHAPVSASELLARTVRSSARPVTVVATGPLTNVAAALRVPGVAAGIGRIQIMGGALRVPGNLYGSALPGFDNSQEFNMWLDPASARAVLHRARPGTVHIVPLDATASAPITQAFVGRLAADHAGAGARITYRIVTQPDLAALIDLGIMYWWDALAAVTAVHDDGTITTFRGTAIEVVQDGEQCGRTVETPGGTRIRAAFEADAAAFEQRFLDSLNGRR